MRFFLVAIVLGACFAYIKADFTIVLNEPENVKVAAHAELTFQRTGEVEEYAKTYAHFLTEADIAERDVPAKPKGIICLIVIGSDVGNKDYARVIKLEEDGEKLEDTKIVVQESRPRFVHEVPQSATKNLVPIVEVVAQFSATENGVKSIKEVSQHLKSRLQEVDYKSMEFAYFEFNGTLEGTIQGNFLCYAVLYSK